MIDYPTPVGDPLPIEGPTPHETVAELDRHVIGQGAAKRAVAIALRNRARRMALDPDVAAEITPRHIIMIGPTGVGKTEIARRLARLSRSPFVKVEASKFTEVGYVGRDVESMVRDLVEDSHELVREELASEVGIQAESNAEDRLLDILLSTPSGSRPVERAELEEDDDDGEDGGNAGNGAPEDVDRLRETLRRQLRRGLLADRSVEIDIRENPPAWLESIAGSQDEPDPQFAESFRGIFGQRTRRTEMLVAQAQEYLYEEEEKSLVDARQAGRLAVERAEDSGIIFIDELDKVASSPESHPGPEISREGVQRDLLPLLDGGSVSTRYGTVRTDHILYIAAGAFQETRPSDLIPELQGRFPIRVELDPLGFDDFRLILVEPENALVKQYEALLGTEGVRLRFAPDGIDALAAAAARANEEMQDIGARRLHTIIEKVLEDVLYDAPDVKGDDCIVDAAYVEKRVEDVFEDEDLTRYIL